MEPALDSKQLVHKKDSVRVSGIQLKQAKIWKFLHLLEKKNASAKVSKKDLIFVLMVYKLTKKQFHFLRHSTLSDVIRFLSDGIRLIVNSNNLWS